jgi:hypothetical protein
MKQKEHQAIDLMLEDLHTSHHEIRIAAKKMNCEKELEIIKNTLIQYLKELK